MFHFFNKFVDLENEPMVVSIVYPMNDRWLFRFYYCVAAVIIVEEA